MYHSSILRKEVFNAGRGIRTLATMKSTGVYIKSELVLEPLANEKFVAVPLGYPGILLRNFPLGYSDHWANPAGRSLSY